MERHKNMQPAYAAMALLVVGLHAVGNTATESITAGDFSVAVSPQLSVSYKGHELFDGDRCAGKRVDGSTVALLDTSAGQIYTNGNTITALSESPDRYFRREVHVDSDAIEITVLIKVFGRIDADYLEYDLTSPGQLLTGHTYTAWKNYLPYAPTRIQGTCVESQGQERHYIASGQCRYYVVDTSVGAVSIDCNPEGPWAQHQHITFADLYTKGDQYFWETTVQPIWGGNVLTGKIVVRPGDDTYEQVHPVGATSYVVDFPFTRGLNFSTPDTDSFGPFDSCSKKAGDGYRWTGDIQITDQDTGGILHRTFAHSTDNSNATLEMNIPSGMYILTLNMYNASQPIGPFSVHTKEGIALADVTVPQGTFESQSALVWSSHDIIRLQYTGKWQVNALSLKLMQYAHEDYRLRRNYWHMHPDEQ